MVSSTCLLIDEIKNVSCVSLYKKKLSTSANKGRANFLCIISIYSPEDVYARYLHLKVHVSLLNPLFMSFHS